ncbi:MAG: hypothetical protein EXR67_01685 [Dehalococcoidia bacterium]|nr:hypothetical protein [Dehalococcoidia bacterium]
MEDRLEATWQALQRNSNEARDVNFARKLEALDRELRSLKIPYEEWEVLFRKKLLVERSWLRSLAGVKDSVREGNGEKPGQLTGFFSRRFRTG